MNDFCLAQLGDQSVKHISDMCAHMRGAQDEAVGVLMCLLSQGVSFDTAKQALQGIVALYMAEAETGAGHESIMSLILSTTPEELENMSREGDDNGI